MSLLTRFHHSFMDEAPFRSIHFYYGPLFQNHTYRGGAIAVQKGATYHPPTSLLPTCMEQGSSWAGAHAVTTDTVVQDCGWISLPSSTTWGCGTAYSTVYPTQTLYTPPASCNDACQCEIFANAVQLFYWPPANSGIDTHSPFTLTSDGQT